ncbi:DNA-binding MarR family transcriptional regulator [Hydrogenispora ethanolica]|uniref:DNA-binding MarR family transcriptional regulator n=1 Tax=Hydrogenispora ethanolica TaxID=1082276 RepID=A0A4V2QFU1_HYDET|nr:MarR family transcriptional regulator [Hydrogenispora ethanolica]TCL73237.1 DNA-binding MarR family transcriptional regulator [Hydrogenispora ethanolica]
MKSSNLERVSKLFCQAISFRILRPSLEKLAKDELTEVQLSCLRFAHLHPEPSVGEIAEGLGISNAASAKLIDRLVKKFLLTREEDPVDRRVLKIKLTPESRRLLEEIYRIEHEQFETLFGAMPEADRKALEQGLSSFLRAAIQAPEQLEAICLRCGWTHDLECHGNQIFRALTGHDKEKV